MKTIDFISLGCSKNLVDSEMLMGLMEAHGYQCTHDSDDPQGEIVVINTCGFLNDAKDYIGKLDNIDIGINATAYYSLVEKNILYQ